MENKLKTQSDFDNCDEYYEYLRSLSTIKNPPSAALIASRMRRPQGGFTIDRAINTPKMKGQVRSHPYRNGAWKL